MAIAQLFADRDSEFEIQRELGSAGLALKDDPLGWPGMRSQKRNARKSGKAKHQYFVNERSGVPRSQYSESRIVGHQMRILGLGLYAS
jgi:hypothetical protein